MDEVFLQEIDNIESKQESIKPSEIILVNEILPEYLNILPIYHRPVFPGVIFPLIITGENIIETVKNVFESDRKLMGAVLIKNLNNDNVLKSELYNFGTVIKIHRMNIVRSDTAQLLMQGLQRFSKIEEISNEPIKWKVKYYYEEDEKYNEELKAYIIAILSSMKELVKLNPLFQEQLKMLMSYFTSEKPGRVMDLVASMTTADADKLEEILETIDLIERAKKLLTLLKEEVELFKIQEKIKKNIEEKITDQQKKFFLNEQLKEIKKELGLEKDEKTAEIEKFEKKLKKLKLTEEAEKVIKEELEKLKVLEPASSEYYVTRTYLEWLTDLPWGIYSKDRLDIKRARKILNKNHYGLDDVKERILEFISTGKKRGKISGSIICLVGPPGVGKTSIGKSIAEALNRKFFRFSVGGMRDEAEIKGHRRTYVGAMPGKIMQSLKRTGTANPVIMLDEIDKMGISFQGDPAAALLEVLDPEQNTNFLDHYLDVRFDLSNVLFITTANQLDTIPQALLDRMEIIKLSGYITKEKNEIAKNFLIPKQLKEHGLKPSDVTIPDETLNYIIEHYSREAGVRGLENQIKKIMRKITMAHAEKDTSPKTITIDNIEKYLGKPLFVNEELYGKGIPGVVTGLAWTSMGGATLYIEASAIKSKNPGFKQTGQLGKVMEESSEIAYSYIRSKVKEFEIPENFFDENFIHLHVPEGATPKDGPSAGITMALALYSLAKNKPIPKNIAMTGEITLTGKVLPIGGVKEKIIAGRRAGIKEFILPKNNKKDFDELPDHIKEGLIIHYVDFFPEILKIVYEN